VHGIVRAETTWHVQTESKWWSQVSDWIDGSRPIPITANMIFEFPISQTTDSTAERATVVAF